MSDLTSLRSDRNRDWSKQLWDGLIEAIEARLAPLEENLGIQREVADAIIARGLTVIEQELAPIVSQADQILNNADTSVQAKIDRFEDKITGGMLLAFSSSPTPIAVDQMIDLVIDVADREFFTPSPYLALSRTSTVANWAIGRVVAFNRTSGALRLQLEQVYGPGGPFHDWCITSLPGAALMQKYYYEQTLSLRGQVANDKTDTDNYRTQAAASAVDAVNAAGASISARNASQQAVADLRQAIAVPLVPPSGPVIGQIWWDGSTTRVYDGVAFVPTVTMSIGGRRYEEGTFGPSPDGVITVGGGFTAAMVYVNGLLLREGDDYTADSPTITVIGAQEGDRYFVEAYLATDATDYDTKEQVNAKIAAITYTFGQPLGLATLDASGKVPTSQLPTLTTTATVGAAMAGANGGATIADGDSLTGVLSGSSTMRRWTWGNIKTWLTALFDARFLRLAGGTVTGHVSLVDGATISTGKTLWRGDYQVVWNDGATYGIHINGSAASANNAARLDGWYEYDLRARGNHTGLQAINTVDGLWNELGYRMFYSTTVNQSAYAAEWYQACIHDGRPTWRWILLPDGSLELWLANWNGWVATPFKVSYTTGRTIIQNGMDITGNVMVNGTLDSTNKYFAIDHPSDPYNKDLIFVSTETPHATIEFWGVTQLVNGEIEVDISQASGLSGQTYNDLAQMGALTGLVNLSNGDTVFGSEIVDGKFMINSTNVASTAKVSWKVSAHRADPAMKTLKYSDPVTGLHIAEHDKPELEAAE